MNILKLSKNYKVTADGAHTCLLVFSLWSYYLLDISLFYFILFLCVFTTYRSPAMSRLIYWKENQGSYDLSVVPKSQTPKNCLPQARPPKAWGRMNVRTQQSWLPDSYYWHLLVPQNTYGGENINNLSPSLDYLFWCFFPLRI